MGPIKIRNGGNYAHAQNSNAYMKAVSQFFLIIVSFQAASASCYI